MNLGQIRSQVREWLDDDRSPYLWSDYSLNQYINQAVDEAVIRFEGIRDDTTTAICQLTIVAGTKDYTIDSRILEVRRVKLASQNQKLNEVSIEMLDDSVAYWETYPDSPPTHYYADTKQNRISIFPTPLTSDTASLQVLRLPLVDLTTDVSEPELEIQHHPGLAHWACYLAYLKRDSDTHDQRKADKHYAEFERWFGKKKDVRDQDFSRFFVPRGVRRRAFH